MSMQKADDFIKIMKEIFSKMDKEMTNDILKDFLKAVYEYCRFCHINNIPVLTEDIKKEITEKFPTIFHHLENGLWDLVMSLSEQNIFDYCRYRSAIQFLFDDFSDFISDKYPTLSSLMSNFELREYFLNYNYDDNFPDPYPEGPVPEHDGVPETHWWWEKVENVYN